MDVGIVGGTGPAGRALAARFAANGLEVVIGSREAARAEAVAGAIVEHWPGHGLSLAGGSNDEAAGAEVVVLATAADATVTTAAALAGRLEDRVVVSMANGVVRVGGELQAVVPARGSIAAEVQAAVPSAKVAAAFHHLPAAELGAIDRPIEADVLVCADSEEAAVRTCHLAESVPGLRALRAGSLAQASAIEAMTAVLINVNVRYRAHAGLRLVGIPSPTPR